MAKDVNRPRNNVLKIPKVSAILVLTGLFLMSFNIACSDGFKALTDQSALSGTEGTPETLSFNITALNGQHAKDYPSIFYLKSNDPTSSIEIVAWEHWFGIGEKCGLATLNADGSYQIDCESKTGMLSVFLSVKINDEPERTLFTEVSIEDLSLSEEEVFPKGRSLPGL